MASKRNDQKGMRRSLTPPNIAAIRQIDAEIDNAIGKQRPDIETSSGYERAKIVSDHESRLDDNDC
jgi:hypothetical protein